MQGLQVLEQLRRQPYGLVGLSSLRNRILRQYRPVVPRPTEEEEKTGQEGCMTEACSKAGGNFIAMTKMSASRERPEHPPWRRRWWGRSSSSPTRKASR